METDTTRNQHNARQQHNDNTHNTVDKHAHST